VRAHGDLEACAQPGLRLRVELGDRLKRLVVLLRKVVQYLRIAGTVAGLGKRLVDPAPGELKPQLGGLLRVARELKAQLLALALEAIQRLAWQARLSGGHANPQRAKQQHQRKRQRQD
jgi:hypothetical protein